MTIATMRPQDPGVRRIPSIHSGNVPWFATAVFVCGIGCGFRSQGVVGNGSDASIDAPRPPLDAPQGFDAPQDIDAGPGVTCFGPSGWQVCFASAPTGDLNVPNTINTDGAAPCLGAQPMGWTAPQLPACFIVGDTITVPGGGTVVNGRRPLVLVANRLITVAGALDVSSKRGDTGMPPSECQLFNQVAGGPSNGVGGGGGAGGSFMTQGGNGGNGDGGTQGGQSSPADTTAPTHLRDGCSGQAGGAAAAGDVGTVGLGGGSVYLLSGDEIAIQNAINASGAGGGGGNKRAGGSGGGSGGMIVLYSSTLTLSVGSVLMAHGGGGGGGGQNGRGTAGSDPSLTLPLLPAAGGDNGGQGYPATMNALDGTGGAGAGDGGGGGGGAAGYIRSNQPLTGAIVSPPADIVP